jgi:hypothetical protein
MGQQKGKNRKYHKVHTPCQIRLNLKISCNSRKKEKYNQNYITQEFYKTARQKKTLTNEVNNLVEFTSGSYNEERKLIAYLQSQQNKKSPNRVIKSKLQNN